MDREFKCEAVILVTEGGRPVAENPVKSNATAGGPNHLWVSDITCV